MDVTHSQNPHGSSGVSPSLASLKHGGTYWEGEATAESKTAGKVLLSEIYREVTPFLNKFQSKLYLIFQKEARATKTIR